MSKYGAGNFGHYRGGLTLRERIIRESEAAKDRCAMLSESLIMIIGKTAYDQWVDDTVPDMFGWPHLEKLLLAALDEYECTCPNVFSGPCEGCKRIAIARNAWAEEDRNYIEIQRQLAPIDEIPF